MLKTAAETPVEVDGKAPGSADAPVTIAAEAMSDVAAPEAPGIQINAPPVKPKIQKQVDKEYERRLARERLPKKAQFETRGQRKKRERANAPKSNRRRNAENDEFDFLPVFALSAGAAGVVALGLNASSGTKEEEEEAPAPGRRKPMIKKTTPPPAPPAKKKPFTVFGGVKTESEPVKKPVKKHQVCFHSSHLH